MVQNNIIKLKSSDGEIFEVNMDVASQSELLKDMLDVLGTSDLLPLLNISSATFSKVIEFCKFHTEQQKESKGNDQSTTTQDDINEWNAKFVKVDEETLHNLIMASDYMHVESLLTLTCQSMAKMITKMTIEEIRQKFNIKNDFTKEEEEEILKQTQWADM